MALSAGTVTIGVKPDTSKFGPDLKSGLGGEIAGVGEGLGKNLGAKLIAGFGALGVAAAIGGAVKTGFGEILDASAGTAQLVAGIKSTGNAANVTVEGLNNLAGSIQGYSGQTDDSIVASEKLLLTFTNIKNSTGQGNDIFNQATKATADLAAKMGGDASGAAIQMGKALNDPVKGITALTRVGVSFDDQQKATIKSMVAHNDVMGAQKIILGELNKEFGGSAQAYGNSLPGMIDRSKRAFEDLTQSLAGALLPIITPIMEGLLKLFQKVQPYIDAFSGKMTDFFKNMTSGGVSFQGILTSLTDGVSNFVSGGGLVKMIEGFATLRTKIVNALIDIVPTLIAELSTAVVKLLPQLVTTLLAMVPQLLQTAQKLFNALIQAVGIVIPNLISAVVGMLPKLVSSIVSMLPSVIDGALNLFMGLVSGLTKAVPRLLTAILDALPKIVSSLISMLPGLISGAMKLFAGLITALVEMTPSLIKAVMGLIPTIVKTLIQMLPLIIDAGFQIVAGLVKGLMDNAPKLIVTAVKSIGTLLIDGVKGVLGIHSPSVVFHDIGLNVTDGLANGLVQGSDNVLSSANTMAADMADRVSSHFANLKDLASKAVADAKAVLADYAASVKDTLTGGINFSQALTDSDNSKQVTATAEDVAVATNKVALAQQAYNDALTNTKLTAADVEKSFLALQNAQGNLDDVKAAATNVGKSFMETLQAQAEKTVKFTDQIKSLVAGGLSKDAIQQVLAAGADAGSRIAQELLNGGSTLIKKANDLIEASKAAAKAAADAAASAFFGAGVKNAQDQLDGYNSIMAKNAPSVSASSTASNSALADRLDAKSAGSLAAVVGSNQTTIVYNAATNDSISSEQKLVDAVNRASLLSTRGRY